MDKLFTKKENDSIQNGIMVITLQNFRGVVTMKAKEPDNVELITAFSIAMQKHSPDDIINALTSLND